MSLASRFPEKLLSDTPTARLQYFREYTIAHPLLLTAHQNLLRAIREPADAGLIFVFGPTGVGKTTLKRHIEGELTKAALPELERNPGRIPFASMEVVAPDSGSFSWRDYYRRALSALAEPFPEHTVKRLPHDRDRQGDVYIGGASATALRLRLEQAIRHRQPVAFINDEAQHLTKMASGRRLQDQLDCIKSLASLTGTVHVLLGTYELLACRNLSAQLSRRALDIHFPRYRLDRKDDVEAFQRALWSFEHHLPLEKQTDLVQHWEFCYECTRGCIGILKGLLAHALADALSEGRHAVTLDLLQRRALSRSQWATIEADAAHGEAQFGIGASSPNHGQDESRAPVDHIVSTDEAGAAGTESLVPAIRRGPPRRVGQRNPIRDPVGEHKRAG